jgi:hypothetical protein
MVLAFQIVLMLTALDLSPTSGGVKTSWNGVSGGGGGCFIATAAQ